MPFQVIKDGDKFKLKKIDDGKIINKTFNSKESAINMAKLYMEYRKEQNIRVVGNKILGTKLSDIKKKKDKNK